MRRIYYGKSSLKSFKDEEFACGNGHESVESVMGVAKTITPIVPCFLDRYPEVLDAPSRSSSVESQNDHAFCLLGEQVISSDENSTSNRHNAEISERNPKISSFKKEEIERRNSRNQSSWTDKRVLLISS